MGLFNTIKNKITKQSLKEETKVYEKGLEKTREEFVSKLSLLGIKYTKVSEEYFEELKKKILKIPMP